MKKYKLLWLGFVAPAVYFFAVVLGGWLWEGYSHVRQPISELTMSSAPNLALMRPLFVLYNLALLGFAVVVCRSFRNVWLRISAAALLLVGVTGVMMLVFPQDPIGSKLTGPGLLHLISAGIAAVSTIAAIFTGGFGVQNTVQDKKFWHISVLLGLIVIVAGGMTPVAITKLPDCFGLIERVTIFSFIVWVCIFARVLGKGAKEAEASAF